MVRMILDTDIGSDVDDALALCFALRSPELSLEGVTTVNGDVDLRARIASKLISLSGRPPVAVRAGIARSLLGEIEPFLMGHEGKGILEAGEWESPVDPQHAVPFIIDMVRRNPGEISLVAIGPLTNIAAAMIIAPDIARKAREVIFIGGVARLADNAMDVPAVEWNVKCDPEAAQIVFNSGATLTMLGMDVTRRGETRLDHEHLARMKAAGTPLADAVARLTEIYWGYAEPRMWCIHDVVAVAYAARRDLVKTQPARVEIETRGRHTAGFTLVTRDPQKSNALVGMEIDQRLRELFMESMCRA